MATDASRAPVPSATAALEVRDVRKRYGRNDVLRGVSLSVGRGEVVGLVGENGAGKTTLLRIIVGMLRPDAGSIEFNGRYGYCPQEPLMFDGLTVRQNLAYFTAAYGLGRREGMRRADALLDRLNCRDVTDRPTGQLSGGTQQKLNLIISLLHHPDLLILDEPYQGFDYESYLAFWRLAAEFANEGRSTLVVSHLVHDQGQLNRLYRMSDGLAIGG